MIVHTRDEIVTEIHRQIKTGVDWIKVHVSGMPIRPHGHEGEIQTWTLDELKLVCDTAHQLGVPVVGHCRNASSVRDAALAGFDMILHATNMDEHAVRAVIDHRVPWSRPLRSKRTWPITEARSGLTHVSRDFSRGNRPKCRHPREVFKAGVPILVGSESGFSLTPYGHWHYRELKILQTYLGMTALEAIRARLSTVRSRCAQRARLVVWLKVISLISSQWKAMSWMTLMCWGARCDYAHHEGW